MATDCFVNLPYDTKSEPLFLAYVAGLCGFGLTPRATLEIPGSQRRLERIFELVLNCPYSIHDLSRVQIDHSSPPTPRFNMPFELGLAVAMQKWKQPKHDWYVFEERRHRIAKSLSDLNGTEVYIHNGTPVGLLREMSNIFVRQKHQPTVSTLVNLHRDLTKWVPALKRNLKTKTVFESRPFRDIVLYAQARAKHYVPSLP